MQLGNLPSVMDASYALHPMNLVGPGTPADGELSGIDMDADVGFENALFLNLNSQSVPQHNASASEESDDQPPDTTRSEFSSDGSVVERNVVFKSKVQSARSINRSSVAAGDTATADISLTTLGDAPEAISESVVHTEISRERSPLHNAREEGAKDSVESQLIRDQIPPNAASHARVESNDASHNIALLGKIEALPNRRLSNANTETATAEHNPENNKNDPVPSTGVRPMPARRSVEVELHAAHQEVPRPDSFRPVSQHSGGYSQHIPLDAPTLNAIGLEMDEAPAPPVWQGGSEVSQVFQPPSEPSNRPDSVRPFSQTVEAKPVSGQLADHIISARHDIGHDTTRIEVTLDPPELGRVSIELANSRDQLTARMLIAEPATLQAIRAELPTLIDSLTEAGVQIDDFQFGQFHDTPNDSGQDDRPNGARSPWPPAEVGSPSEHPDPISPGTSSAVDVIA